MTLSIAVYGGSFNPPHVVHVLVAAYVVSVFEVDELLVVPTFLHPFDKTLERFDHRFEMCRLAFEELARVRVSDVERRLGGRSRTVRTLLHLQDTHPDWSMRLVVGSDVLHESAQWVGFDKICEIAPPIVVQRSGSTTGGDVIFPAVSSTGIRGMLARDEIEIARPLLPRSVLSYVTAHALYGCGGSEGQ